MYLRDRFGLRKPASISAAFQITTGCNDGGQVENAAAEAANALEKIGDLIELLYEKQLINTHEMLDLVGSRWEIEP